MVKLAFFDIDGTLFDEKRKIYPPSAARALQRLRERGILVCVATGRPPFTAETLRQAGIEPDYLVCSNGHLVLDGAGNILASSTFSPELVGEVREYCREQDIGLLFKYPASTLVCRNDPEFDAIFSKNPRTAAFVRYAAPGDRLPERPNGGCLACDTGKLSAFNRRFTGQCLGVDINGRSSDLILWGVNKWTGAERLLERIGISPAECIAFGDNRNDLEMIRGVGIGVAMGNGEEILKRESDYVTASVEADGIWKGLEHFGLI